MASNEELLTRIMNHLAEFFRARLVLKGGMLLRLYNSPRLTQDIDFILLSQKSRKILKGELLDALRKMDGIEVTRVEVNSRGIFLDVAETQEQQKVLIEVNVAPSTHLPPEPLSTAALSRRHAAGGRVISAMALPEAFSHKIAAALERNALRDLYDLSQFEAMGPFDLETLRARLSRVSIQRAKPKSIGPGEAADILRRRLAALDPQRVETELYPVLPAEYRPGVLRILQASVGRIIQRLEALEGEWQNSDSSQ